MGIFDIWMCILKRFRKPKKERALVFVDYEHWFFSYKNLFGIKPDIKEWYDNICTRFQIEEAFFFADFTGIAVLRDEPGHIRKVSDSIIETGNLVGRNKKDMSDFVMLDYIYRKAMEHSNIKYFVLFTGDGHFQSVVKFLRDKCGKKVIQYGVKGCCSKQLCDAALEHYSVPAEDIKPSVYYPMIIERLDWAAKHPEVIVTFMNTVRYVSQRNEVSEAIVIQALNQMLERGFICKKRRRIDFNNSVLVLSANWDKLQECGLWSPETKNSQKV